MGRLTSQIAHELNNPLYGIMNTLELMKSEIPVGNKRRKLLDMSLLETVRVTDMLRKMLSFSKPDQEERAPVDINIILDEILLLHEKQLWEHSIKVVHSFADHLGNVNASKNQLRQVFLNLISNARDAMPDCGRLTVATEGDDYFVFLFSSLKPVNTEDAVFVLPRGCASYLILGIYFQQLISKSGCSFFKFFFILEVPPFGTKPGTAGKKRSSRPDSLETNRLK